jgi:hypothetical protein
MASYFSYFPNVYVGEGISSDESFKYRLVKNIFRRVKAREDLDKYTTLFEAYSIRDGETPSSLAYRLYDDVSLDWVVLLVNNITDIYTQWPKLEVDLQNYVNEVYDDAEGVHHYETQEVLYDGIILVEKGIQVNSTWRTVMPNGDVLPENQSIYPVSNYEHEAFLNDKKRLILLPEPSMVELMVSEMFDLLEYQPHTELDDLNNKKSPLSLSSLFLTSARSSGYTTNISNVGETVTSFDYGPTASGVSSVASTISATGVANTAAVTTTSSSSSSSSGSSGGSGY